MGSKILVLVQITTHKHALQITHQTVTILSSATAAQTKQILCRQWTVTLWVPKFDGQDATLSLSVIETATFSTLIPLFLLPSLSVTASMAEDDYEESELSDSQKLEIAKWFLLNAPVGEIKYIAKDLRSVVNDDSVYNEAAAESFPQYNKAHMVCLEMPRRCGEVLITSYSEIDGTSFLDPRTAQVATVDHIKQVCTEVRPATDEELPSAYIEEFRYAVDAEVLKYVGEAYPKGFCSVYCVNGKDVEEPGSDFELVVVISAARHSPQNFCNGSWRSVWNIEFKDDMQVLEIKGNVQVVAHYFEEGNVQLDTKHECRDSTIFQEPEDCAITIANIIRHHETEYMASLQASYSNLPDTTFKDLRRKLPVTRTLFPWHSTHQFSLTRDIAKQLGIQK